MPRMLDLFSRLGGASRVMRERGWSVIRADIDARFTPDVCADLCAHTFEPMQLDLLWASPPCDEFSRESMPWCRTGVAPSLECIRATLRHVEALRPRYWVLENVRGARSWLRELLGPPVISSGPVFLWGSLPPVLLPDVRPWKENLSSARRAERAVIPVEISRAFALAIERQAECGRLTA